MLTGVCPDSHAPWHDTDEFEAWIRKQRPKRLVLLGDHLDFHAITEHPRNRKWADRLDYELKVGRRWLQNLRTVAGNAEITYICGNHERRLDRAIDKHLPALRNINHMSVPAVLGLGDLGIKWHDAAKEKKGVKIPCGQGKTVYAFHGDELKGKHKNSSPLNFCLAFGQNVHLGHSHRMSLEHTVIGGKELFAVEGGYLGKPKAPAFTYAGPAPKNWQRGWCVYDAESTRSPYPTFHRCT